MSKQLFFRQAPTVSNKTPRRSVFLSPESFQAVLNEPSNRYLPQATVSVAPLPSFSSLILSNSWLVLSFANLRGASSTTVAGSSGRLIAEETSSDQLRCSSARAKTVYLPGGSVFPPKSSATVVS